MILNPDGSLVCEPRTPPPRSDEKRIYYTELPQHEIERDSTIVAQLIDFAFGILGARHVEVRVCDPN
jgi:hypothetical protein